MPAYHRPDDLSEACTLLAAGPLSILAGGTDVYAGTTAQQLNRDILDVTGIAALRGIARDEAGWRIGGAVTWSELIAAGLPPAFDALKRAAREVGSEQIQNAGTIAGNLCNASPAADGVPALMVLDAEVALASAAGRRRLPLGAFLTGPRQTALAPGELVEAVHVPAASAAGASDFLKLGARRYLVISIAMVAVRLAVEEGRVAAAAIAVGACSPVARRFAALEAALVGEPATPALALRVTEAGVAPLLAPIDDVRGSAAYRAGAAAELIRRALARLTEGAR
ncbi:MAG TPA: FAD binding domain-containing protein [Thermohalobaculum sp.]|nr:FAD binding domain-containing protein [Thermohalobaculum sp.]